MSDELKVLVAVLTVGMIIALTIVGTLIRDCYVQTMRAEAWKEAVIKCDPIVLPAFPK